MPETEKVQDAEVIEVPQQAAQEAAPATEKKPQELAVQRKAPLVAQQDGVIVGSTFEEQWRVASAIAGSGFWKNFNTPEKVWTVMQFARELGIRGGVSALRQIYLVNGQPALWGDLPLALIKKSGKLKEHIEYFFDTNGQRIAATDTKTPKFGAYCSMERNDEPGVTEATFTFENAKTAGLMGKDTYKGYGPDMLMYRARGRCSKSKFPDVLMGAAIGEYDYGITGDQETGEQIGDVPAPAPRLSEKLNAQLLPANEVAS